MSWKSYLMIIFISLVLALILASFQSAPGYMDAEYYFSMALRIANKQGFSEPFVWNYFNPVSGIPHPGFSYWMPLPALVSAVGIWISGVKTFSAARALHLVLAAMIPALTMKLAFRLTESKGKALLAAAFAVVPVFYNGFLGTTDSFAIVMVLGALYFMLVFERDLPGKFLGLGALAGLMHLARADGLIWVLAGLYCALRAERGKGISILLVGAGYLCCMGPWYARNLLELGSLMPGGISKALWLTEYNDLFLYDTGRLTFQNWISQGLPVIALNIGRAGLANLKSALLIQGQVILGPFAGVGLWEKRRLQGLEVVGLLWLAIFLLMTGIFPFAGMRGGYFHSGAAFQPLIWVLASSGFFKAIEWGVNRRHWDKARAGRVFGMALVALVALASSFVFFERVIGDDFDQPAWNKGNLAAAEIDRFLDDLGLDPSEPVLINNPPGLYSAAARPSIAIPSESMEAVLQAGADFDIRYLVLESNHPRYFSALYLDPDADSRLIYLGKTNQALIFIIAGSGENYE